MVWGLDKVFGVTPRAAERQGQEGIPQRLKPLVSCGMERPKAEALGYPEATAKATARIAKAKAGADWGAGFSAA